MSKIKVIVCGDKDFAQNIIEACSQDNRLAVAGVSVGTDLKEQIEKTSATGVIAPTEDDWVETVIAMSRIKKNVSFFVSGSLKRDQHAQLLNSKVIPLPQDPVRAVRGMALSLERISPTSFHYRDGGGQVIMNNSTVAIIKRITVLFYSIKGGVGKTTTVANAAATAGMWARQLYKKTGKNLRVFLLDNNPDGSVKKYFGYALFGEFTRAKSLITFKDLPPQASLETVMQNVNYHEASNVYFSSSPDTIHEKRQFAPEMVRNCLELATKHFDFVFIDMGVHLDDEAAMIASEYATDVVLVTDTDPMTVSLLCDHRDEIIGLFGGAGRFNLVVNQRDRDADHVTAREAAEILDVPFAAELPYCMEIKKALKSFAPVVCTAPNDKYSLEIAKLSQKILGTRAIELAQGRHVEKRQSLFSRIFRKRGQGGE